MKRREKILLLISIVFAVGLFCFAKEAFASTEVHGDIVFATTWTKANSPYIILQNTLVKAPLTIEAGVVVKFTNIMPGPGPWEKPGLSVRSSFSAVGDPLESVVFTSACDSSYGGDTSKYCVSYNHNAPIRGDWGGIYVVSEYRSPVSFEYAKILYASNGIHYDNNKPNLSYKELSVKRTEISQSAGAGIWLRLTQPTLDGLILTNNYNGVEIYDAIGNQPAKIRNSVIAGNFNGVNAYRSTAFDARYNYWGVPSGPYYDGGSKEQENYAGQGNRIVGTSVMFRPWDQSDPTIPKEPVIFIPGIGASINPDLMISGVLADNWTMFDHTYDGILQAFKVMGYVEGKNFFIAYYDWRKSNAESAEKYLKPLIQKALAQSDASKVNIVTHSMGSLVARSYVQSSAYASDVDNLIMIAPPNKGSSDVYTAWEGGRIPNNWTSKFVMKVYLEYLTDTTPGTSNYYDTIHKYIPSLKDLMPTYDFLSASGEDGDLKNYLSMNEKNGFLLNLNSGTDILNQRTRFSIILGDKQSTVNKIPTIDSDKDGIWLDGKPDPIDPQKNDDRGDGEVLIASGDVSSDFRDVLEYDHREIVSRSEKIVAERLNENLTDIFDSPEIKDEIIFWTDAPADMQITDPDGGVVSKDNNGITDAIYSQEQKRDGFKIVSVPNVKKGDYSVSLKGNADGKYHVSVLYADHSGNSDGKSESQEIEVKKDQPQEFVVPTDPGAGSDPIAEFIEKDVAPPIISFSSFIEGKEYYSNEKITIKMDVSDNVTALENILTEIYLDETQVHNGDVIDLSKLKLGKHEISLYAEDEAGNYAYPLALSFFIVNPPPPPADVIAPVITITGLEDGKEYFADEKITLSVSATDNISNSAVITTKIYLDGEIIANGLVIDLSMLALGVHTISVQSVDEAGNEAVKNVSFTIVPAPAGVEDITAPVIKIKVPEEGKKYEKTEKITLEYEVSDDVSDADEIETEIFLDDEKLESDEIDFSDQDIGEHILKISAIDEADNKKEASVSFSVIANVASSDDENSGNNSGSDVGGGAGDSGSDADQTADADGVATNTGQIVIAQENNQQDDNSHKSKKHKNKSDKKTSVSKNNSSSKGGVTKYSGKIKIISSTNNLQVKSADNKYVLGASDGKNMSVNNFVLDVTGLRGTDSVASQRQTQQKSFFSLLADSNGEYSRVLGKLQLQNYPSGAGGVLSALTASDNTDKDAERIRIALSLLFLLAIFVAIFFIVRDERGSHKKRSILKG